MALPSGADVKIGTYEFQLDRSNESGAYQHSFESLYSQQQEIQGSPGKRTGNPSILLWRMRDWSGGSGNKFWDNSDPSVYYDDVSANPRIPGQVQSRPPLLVTTGLTATSAAPSKIVFGYSEGVLWMFANRQAFYSSNGTSWTAHPSNPIFGVGYQISAAAGARDEIWVSAHDGTTRQVLKVTTGATATAVANVNGPRFIGMAEKGGFIFGWTGRNLLRYNPQNTLPIAQAAKHKVYKPYNDNPTGTWYGDVAASENAVYVLISYAGDSTVHEFRRNRGFPIWQLPSGVTAKSICYNLGVLYVLGEYNDRISLFGMSVQSRQWFYLADFKAQALAGTTLTAKAIAPSFGAQVIGAVSSSTKNYLFVYDAELDAISELDETTVQPTVDAATTYLGRRLFGYFNGTTVNADSYQSDFAAPASGWTLDSGADDLGFPMDEKLLLGVHVVQDPSIANATVQVYYQLDEDGNWTSAGTTVAGSKHTYFTVSTNASTKKFRQLRIRMVGTNGCRVFSVTPRCYIDTYQEIWRLRLKLMDEKASSGPSTRRFPAWKLRDFLLTTAAQRNVVAFLDGTRYPEKGAAGQAGPGGTPASVDVIIEFPTDQILNDRAEGSIEVILRAVAP